MLCFMILGTADMVITSTVFVLKCSKTTIGLRRIILGNTLSYMKWLSDMGM